MHARADAAAPATDLNPITLVCRACLCLHQAVALVWHLYVAGMCNLLHSSHVNGARVRGLKKYKKAGYMPCKTQRLTL